MEVIKRYTLTDILLFILFLFSFQEFGIQIGGDGVSANYLYVLIPLFLFFWNGRHELSVPIEVILLLLFFSFIYVVGIPKDIIYLDDAEVFRRFASYAVFIAPFTLTFVKFDSQDLHLFKMAVVVACLYYSALNLYDLFYWTQVVGADLSDLKGKIGSQRYGFVLLLGFFIMLFEKGTLEFGSTGKFFKWVALFVILCGIYLTYSKTVIVSLVMTLLVYMVLNYKVFGRPNIKGVAVFFLLTFSAISLFVSMYLDAFLHAISFDANNHETSLGYRVYMFDLVMQFLAENPVFGSTYQGIYTLYDQLSGGSVHNQFLDVWLRLGLIGFIVWLYVLGRILLVLKIDKSLFFGMISILIFGLMHETFKLAWGGFIFGMLLSFSYSYDSLFKKRQAR